MRCVTRTVPKRAEQWWDDLCFLSLFINPFLSFFGGESPLFLYMQDKCYNPGGGSTT
jgi:hypothetical protein